MICFCPNSPEPLNVVYFFKGVFVDGIKDFNNRSPKIIWTVSKFNKFPCKKYRRMEEKAGKDKSKD